jgi:hypothetical protein
VRHRPDVSALQGQSVRKPIPCETCAPPATRSNRRVAARARDREAPAPSPSLLPRERAVSVSWLARRRGGSRVTGLRRLGGAAGVVDRSRGKVAAGVQQILDAMTGAAAFLRNDRLDVLAGNPLGYALYCEVFESAIRPPNTIRYVFLDPAPNASTATGRAPPTTALPSCAPSPGATPTTATFQISSGSSRPKATSSAPAGTPTASAFTSAASSTSTTQRSATSAPASTASTSPPTRA